MVQGTTPTDIRTMTICQDGVSVNVTLWRDLADTPLEIGAYVEVNSCQVNSYQSQKQLNSTVKTTIKVSKNTCIILKLVFEHLFYFFETGN